MLVIVYYLIFQLYFPEAIFKVTLIYLDVHNKIIKKLLKSNAKILDNKQ